MKELKELQSQLALALQEQESAEQAAKNAQADYDIKLAEFEAQNVDLCLTRDNATTRKSMAKFRVSELREQAKKVLGADFIDDELPEGFTQKRAQEVIYDPQGLFKVAVDRFPFLLKLDNKAVDSFFTKLAVEQKDGALVLPENIRCWASVEIIYKPLVAISNTKLLKLKVESPVDESDDALSQVKTHLEEFAEENDIDPEQSTDMTEHKKLSEDILEDLPF